MASQAALSAISDGIARYRRDMEQHQAMLDAGIDYGGKPLTPERRAQFESVVKMRKNSIEEWQAILDRN